MEVKPNMENILKPLYRHRKKIGIVTGVAVILTIIISLTLPNYFKATTIFYVASPDLSKPEHLFGKSQKDTEYFGDESDVERVMTLARSGAMYQYLIDSMDLINYYDADTSTPNAKFRLHRKIEQRFTLVKTPSDAIELSFEDEDPEFAAKVANGARQKLDEITGSLMKEKLLSVISAFQSNLVQKADSLGIISDSLQQLRSRYNIINTASQSEMLASMLTETESKLTRESAKFEALKDAKNVKRDTIELIGATVSGLIKELEMLKSKDQDSGISLDRFNEGRILIELMEAKFYSAREYLGYDAERLKILTAAYEAQIPSIHLVEVAAVPLMKSRPKRSIYVIMALLMSFIFSCLGVLIFETYKQFDWKSITEN